MLEPWNSLSLSGIRRTWWQPEVPDLPPLPMIAARGVNDGPRLLITAGVHGDEYEGPFAIHRLFERIDMTRLSGTIIGLPVVNTAAWKARARRSPLDDVDLNRVFPGDARIGVTSALAEKVFDAFVRPCNAMIDLHSGGAALVHLPLIGWYASGGRDDESLARRFDSRLNPWIIPDVPGVLSYEACRAGKRAIAAEWGGGARLDPDGVAAYAGGLIRLLAMLGMLPEKSVDAVPIDERHPIAGDYQAAPASGLLVPQAALGDRVVKGQSLGAIYDMLGNAVMGVHSERGGIVAGLAHRPWLNAGDRVAYVG